VLGVGAASGPAAGVAGRKGFVGRLIGLLFFSAARAWALKLVEAGLITEETLQAAQRTCRLRQGHSSREPPLRSPGQTGPDDETMVSINGTDGFILGRARDADKR
jgi:hypothetical protein